VIFKSPERYVTKFEGAESFEELYARTGDFIKEIVNPGLAEGKDILIVGHGAMNLSIVCQIKGIPIEKFWSTEIKNCKLMRLI
jgi:probable phosphoglycerate mutase